MLCSNELSSKQTVINHIKKKHHIECVSDDLFCVAQLEIIDNSGESSYTGGNLHSGGFVDTGGELNTVWESNIGSDCEENTSCQVNRAVSHVIAGDNVNPVSLATSVDKVNTVSHASAGENLSSGVTKGCVIIKSTKKQKKPHGFLQNLMNILDDPDKMEEINSIKQKNDGKSDMPSPNTVSSSSLPRQLGCITSSMHPGHPTNAIKLPTSGIGNIQLRQFHPTQARQTPGPQYVGSTKSQVVGFGGKHSHTIRLSSDI